MQSLKIVESLINFRRSCRNRLELLCLMSKPQFTLMAVALIIGLARANAFAQSPTLLTHCQRITKSGTYSFKITSPAAHTGYCIDVVAPNVIFSDAYNTLLCNGFDNGIKVESTATQFSWDGGTQGGQINNCVIGLRIVGSINGDGVMRMGDPYYGGYLQVNGAQNCRYAIKIDQMYNFTLAAGDIAIQMNCPGGQALSIGGSTYFTGDLSLDVH